MKSVRRQFLLAGGLALSLALITYLEIRGAAASQLAYATSVRQIEQMSADAATIQSLRGTPRLAVDRERPNDELLGQVKTSLLAAGVPLENWVSHDPSAAVRVPKTPYKQCSVRLTLNDLSLRQLVDFAFALVGNDPSLRIYRLRLTVPPKGRPSRWNVDLTLGYLIFAPSAEA